MPLHKVVAFMLKAGILVPLFIQSLGKSGGAKKVVSQEVRAIDDALFKRSGFDKKYLKRHLKRSC